MKKNLFYQLSDLTFSKENCILALKKKQHLRSRCDSL